jgi:protein-disulfide isomerase
MAAKNAAKPKDNFTKYLALGMVVFVVLAGIAASIYNNHSNGKVYYPSISSNANGNGISFNANAKVKVDMWEDFQCPHCQEFEAVNNTYIDSLVSSGKIQAVYHPMSFIGPESILTANAAACAADEGKFLQYHRALYANQPATENSGFWTTKSLTALGATLGLSDSKFTSCVANGKYSNWVAKIESDASTKGVNATPTLFINGTALPQSDYLNQKALAADLAKAGLK